MKIQVAVIEKSWRKKAVNSGKLYEILGISKEQCEDMGIEPISLEGEVLKVHAHKGAKMYKTMLEYTSGKSIEFVREVPSGTVTTIDSMKDTNNIPKVVDSIISHGISMNASDIHIEIYQKSYRVRNRVDGKLEHSMNLPLEWYPQITTKVKIMSEMDISEKRIPQDGRFTFSFQGREIDIRVSTSPTLRGEKLV